MVQLIQAEYFSTRCEVPQMEVYREWWCGEEEAALRVIQNALSEWERTIKWCVIYTS